MVRMARYSRPSVAIAWHSQQKNFLSIIGLTLRPDGKPFSYSLAHRPSETRQA